jgi:predicted N-acetyltransferase YhbS
MAKANLEWRGDFDNHELNRLHAEAFGHPVLDAEDWAGRVRSHSLGWVTAREGQDLVGFVNVVWDGSVHAFILDTMVKEAKKRQGIGTGLVKEATKHARAAGCEWLHVDFEDKLHSFYYSACGFQSTPGGLIKL